MKTKILVPLVLLSVLCFSGVIFATSIAGDVNNDGILNALDQYKLEQYILGNNLNINTQNADLNADGQIDSLDLAQLAILTKGDVNDDNIVNSQDRALLLQYLLDDSISINAQEADVNRDGTIDSLDLAELTIALKGDVNDDGFINPTDKDVLQQYLLNNSVSINLQNSDVNNDGVIDALDNAELATRLQ